MGRTLLEAHLTTDYLRASACLVAVLAVAMGCGESSGNVDADDEGRGGSGAAAGGAGGSGGADVGGSNVGGAGRGGSAGNGSGTGGIGGSNTAGSGAEAGSDGDAGAGTGGDGTGGGAGAGSGGSAGTSADDRLLPLEVGRRWTFARTVFDGALPVRCETPLESNVISEVTLENDSGWNYHPACAPSPLRMFLNGDAIWGYTTSELSSRFDYAVPPVEEGASWTSGYVYAWHDEGTVEVPAGTFDRCWRRTIESQTDAYIVLCRGIGLVIVNAAADNYRLELTSKNF